MTNVKKVLYRADFTPRSYSGRGMYGKTCLAVETDSFMDLFSAVLAVIDEAGENASDLASEMSGAFRGACTDSLGMGYVVYFPDIPYTESDESAGQDDEEEAG